MKGETHQKDYAVMEFEISPLGYLLKVERHLGKDQDQPIPLAWPIKNEEKDHQGRLLYKVSEVAVKFI